MSDLSVMKQLDQQVGTLKLSDAIRIGARMGGQCFGETFADDRSCALGAGILGAGLSRNIKSGPLLDYFSVPFAVVCEITRRNDSGQTREQIADWLESIGY